MNICVKCCHYKNGSFREKAGYWDHFCAHPDLKRTIGTNPVTGEKGYFTQNDLGKVYMTDDSHPYCHDINTNGECELFVAKGWIPNSSSELDRKAPTP